MNGLSTLNRLLGKRNKDVSKSTSNLSRSTTNLDASSHYTNKVIQLPVVANAPFEQTFRVTVLLPRDQLYVARVGAKTKLSTLLEMVCSDKLLDAQKYVFRHPADFQQGFELDMNIGEVGLSEIRMMSRKELETLRNSDYRLSTSDIFRMHQKGARETSGGTSVSSSDLSRTSKLALKTNSPYSSTNSLNSMDSSGVSSSSRGGGGGHSGITNGSATNGHSQTGQPPVAPTRKKRLAPRPPSQTSIPEVRVIPETQQHSNGGKHGPDDHIFKEPQLPPYSRANFHVSTPNLYDRELKTADIINNNNSNGSVKPQNANGNGYSADLQNNNNLHDVQSAMLDEEDRKNLINTKTSYSTLKNRPTSMYIIREPDANSLQRANENGGSMVDIQHHHSRASSSCSDAKDPRDFQDMPEPTPRKRLNSSAKKSKAPAPPPRAKTTITPVPTPSPRALTRSTLDLLRDNDAAISETDSNFSSEPDDTHRNRESRLNAVNGSVHRAPYTPQQQPQQQNVSKVMLNVEQAPLNDPIVTSTTPNNSEKKHQKSGSTSSSVSIKIVGNGVGDTQPKPSSTTPIVSKVQIGGGNQPVPMDLPASPGDNSSDEEIKIYNIESGKALIKKKAQNGTEMEQEQRKPTHGSTQPAVTNGTKVSSANVESTERSAQNAETNQSAAEQQTTNGVADEEQWTYKLPAPPKFADSSIKTSDYDERGQFYRPASTFVDNTTLRSDMLTVVSDDQTERIEPFIQERLQTMLDLTAGGVRDALQQPFYPGAVDLRPDSPVSVSTATDATTHVSEDAPHISSDLEDGYRVGGGVRTEPDDAGPDSTHEAREVWLQTLEKRREKIIEGELSTLSESIGGGKAGTNAPTVVRSQSTVSERKSSVMSELNQLLRDGVELSRKEEAEIAVVNRSSLANFKISTYSSSDNKENIITSTSTTTIVEKQTIAEGNNEVPVVANGVSETKPLPESQKEEQRDIDVIVRRKISVDSMTVARKPHSLTQSSDEDDPVGRHANGYAASGAPTVKKELAPVKRRSLTMLNKSPRVINRSDSFHSTRSDYIQSLNSPAQNGTSAPGPLHLTPRSTSYISLIGAQRWENRTATNASLATANSFNRRKSASELSICDSPSLQSLEVIKNILNTSRKNSINNLHQTNGSAAEVGTPGDDGIVLPSMAAIKRNSFTDISTLVQLNGTSKGHMSNGSGLMSNAVRKDSIEEAKIEQEPEVEPEPEPEGKPKKQETKENSVPIVENILGVVNKTEQTNVKEVELTVEKRVEKIISPESKQEEIGGKLIVQKTIEEKLMTEKTEWITKPEEQQPAVDLASESKSDDEKLQNKQQQRQQIQHIAAVTTKEPQTTVVSITNTNTVVSSSSSSTVVAHPPSNEPDTKKWTYQGPPTISFATWNERPKIDVSIKSDRDYRFGGSSTLPRGFRNVNIVSSTKISIGPGGSTTTTVESSSGYMRRTIHEVDQTQQQPEEAVSNVPSTETAEAVAAPSQGRQLEATTAVVKLPATSPKPTATPPGERLPIVRAVEYKKNVATAQRQAPPAVEPKPSFYYDAFARNDSSKNSVSSSSSGSNSLGTNVSSVSINGTAIPSPSISTNISRLSFGPKPPTVLQPTVRGFKSLDIEPTGLSTTTTTTMPRLRPVSMIDTSTLRKTSTVPLASAAAENEAPNSLPFSQHTLRRTGLKDKILAKDPAPVAEPVTTSTKVSVTTAAAPTPVRPVSLPVAAPVPPPPAPLPPVKASQPVVRGAIVKKSPVTTPAIDPRTALLDAIRSFNKDSLRKE
uniref:WH2 domain-containing protein n=1 Tax=Anopheles epiroticus TaxID=199890 RepID=A0A182P8Z1_9DIPT